MGRSGSAEAPCPPESRKWGGLPVLLLALTDVFTPSLSAAHHPLPWDRVLGSCQLPQENKLFPGVLAASSCLLLPAPACAVGWGQCLWHRQAVQQGSSTAKDIVLSIVGSEHAGESLSGSQHPSCRHFPVAFPWVPCQFIAVHGEWWYWSSSLSVLVK